MVLNQTIQNIKDMSSWGSKAPKRRIRLGYHQVKPLGTFTQKTLPATVVSAYYEMPSKYSKEEYRTWIRLFLEHCEAHILFFCEESFKPFVEVCRSHFPDRTHIQILDRSEWIANSAFSQTFWETQYAIDPENKYHSVDLYKVWYEKKEFVKRAIALNPWNHTDFVWTDAGILRSEGLCRLVEKEFPHPERIPTDRILLLNVGEFTEKDNAIQTINGIPFRGGALGKMRIGGGIVAGSIESWKRYDRLYESIIDKYIQAKLFIGKEQIIMATLVLEHPDTVSLVEPKPICPEFWFYLLVWLGASSKLYNRMISDNTNIIRYSYEDLLRFV